MIVQTRTVVFARPQTSRNEGRFTFQTEAYGPKIAGYGIVEVVESTTVRYLKADHTAFPGKPEERVEKVLLTLPTGAAIHLAKTLTEAVAESLETRGPGGYAAGHTTTHEA